MCRDGCVRKFGLLTVLPYIYVFITVATSSEYGTPIEIKVWDTGRKPLAHMVDVTNEFGLKVLAEHNFLNENNIAFSPYGLMGILIALYEGIDGESSYQMQRGMQLPWNRNVMRIGFRDIHRTLKTYFIPEEGFLAGLALNNENVTFNDDYKKILKFYGFDLDNESKPPPPVQNDDNPTISTPTTINATNAIETSTVAMASTTSRKELTTSKKEETTPRTDVVTVSKDVNESSITTVRPDPAAKVESASTLTTPLSSKTTTTATTDTETVATDATILNMTATTELATTPTSTSASTITSTTTTPITATAAISTMAEVSTVPVSSTASVTEGLTVNNEVELISTTEAVSSTLAESSLLDTSTIENLPTNALTDVTGSTTESLQTESSTELSTTTESLTTTNSTGATDSTIESLQKRKRSVIDFIYTNPPYVDEYLIRSYDMTSSASNYNNDKMFLANGLRNVQVTYMHYNTVLEYAYLPHLEASALRLPLDSDRYYLLIILPLRAGEIELGKLLARMARESDLKDVHGALRPRKIKAIVPSFTVKGHITLTTDLQKLGIRDVFEPRQRDFTLMTPQPGVYVRSIEQAVSVAIRKYKPDDHKKNRYVSSHQPIEFSATYPFLYFVMDSSIHVALMAGKMVDPLNTRIL